MKKYTIAILGASGAVGKEIIKGLEERDFPVHELRLLSSERSAGKKAVFYGNDLTLKKTDPTSFGGCDLVFGAADNDISKMYADDIKKAKALFIDNSSAFRLDQQVPLVVPEINGEDVLNHQGIIANPNCSTIIGCIAVYAIHQINPIKSMNVSTYQAVSGAGIGGMNEYIMQIRQMAQNIPLTISAFSYPIIGNLIPQIGNFLENGYTSEEMKMQSEGRKILHIPNLSVSCTCVRVPVLRSHSLSMTLQLENSCDLVCIKEALSRACGCKLIDDPVHEYYPMPLYATCQDLVFVGRIRSDLSNDHLLNLWCCGDQLRKGAAINAIQIAEKCIEYKLL